MAEIVTKRVPAECKADFKLIQDHTQTIVSCIDRCRQRDGRGVLYVKIEPKRLALHYVPMAKAVASLKVDGMSDDELTRLQDYDEAVEILVGVLHPDLMC